MNAAKETRINFCWSIQRKILEEIEKNMPKILEDLNPEFWDWMRDKEPTTLRFHVDIYFNYTKKEREEEI